MSNFRHCARRFQSGQLPHRSDRACQDRRPAVLRRSGFSPEFWRFFSRIALCSLCTIMPLRFVQVYKVFYLCEMLLTICGKCAKIQTVREQNTQRQPEGPAEERSGGTVRTLARGNAPGACTPPEENRLYTGETSASTAYTSPKKEYQKELTQARRDRARTEIVGCGLSDRLKREHETARRNDGLCI